MYGRNLFESLEIKAINNLLNAMEKGAKLTYIDPRVSITATKADRYWMIRPGTDLALNYALIHTILKERLYDAEYVRRWVKGLKELQAFVEPYTPEWAEAGNRHPGRRRSSPWPGKPRRPNPRWSSTTATGARTIPMRSISAAPSSS